MATLEETYAPSSDRSYLTDDFLDKMSQLADRCLDENASAEAMAVALGIFSAVVPALAAEIKDLRASYPNAD